MPVSEQRGQARCFNPGPLQRPERAQTPLGQFEHEGWSFRRDLKRRWWGPIGIPMMLIWGRMFTISLKCKGNCCASSAPRMRSSFSGRVPFQQGTWADCASTRVETRATWQSRHIVKPSRNSASHNGQSIQVTPVAVLRLLRAQLRAREARPREERIIPFDH